MGLYKRGNIWWFSITIKGKQFRFSTRTADRKKATEIYARALLELDNPGKENEPVTFNDFMVNQYLPFTERQNSYQSKKYYFKVIPDWFKRLTLSQISTRELELLQGDLLKGRTPASVNRIIAMVKHSLKKACEWELVGEETLKKVQRVKPLKGEIQRLRFLSLEECHKLIEAAEPHLKPIIITALNTGMRKGEILNLTWNQIDLKHGYIHLDRTKNGERRDIPVNSTLKALFKELFKKRRLDTDYVFVNPDTGKKYHDIKRSFTTACRRAGITDFRFHDLRHTFASHLVMNGVDLKTVQELLGHKTIKMTLKYSHLSKAHKEKAVNTLNITIYHNFITIRQERG